jgi:hypothetical protein
VTPAELQRLQAAAMMEDELQNGIHVLCTQLRIGHYHTHDSRRSNAGFPDSVIAHDDGPIYTELKREKRRPTVDQVAWLDYFARHGLRVYLWRPTHLLNGTIAMILSGQAVGEGLADGRWIAGEGVRGDRWSVAAGNRRHHEQA